MPVQNGALTNSSDRGRAITTSTQGSTLADVLERVLDKGIVIAGDISVSVGSTELLNIRIRLLISSVDKAREIGINWWESDPYLSRQALPPAQTEQIAHLQQHIERLEAELKTLRSLSVADAESTPTGG
ncbi:MAG: gas vesicle protein [Cyanobacteria bacterium]|nr:gas vesicle protein [Cyanobacteriota bacterium]MDW8201599.1 gas vesicle protein [Cyanobacteriota bacterium SKYGB_h_bin112]